MCRKRIPSFRGLEMRIERQVRMAMRVRMFCVYIAMHWHSSGVFVGSMLPTFTMCICSHSFSIKSSHPQSDKRTFRARTRARTSRHDPF
jgi:hypothetical protein